MAELTPDENAGAIRGGCVQAGHWRLVGTLGTWQGGTRKGEGFTFSILKKCNNKKKKKKDGGGGLATYNRDKHARRPRWPSRARHEGKAEDRAAVLSVWVLGCSRAPLLGAPGGSWQHRHSLASAPACAAPECGLRASEFLCFLAPAHRTEPKLAAVRWMVPLICS